MPTIRSSGSKPHRSSTRGGWVSAGVDQNVARPIDVAARSRFWMPAATASRFSTCSISLWCAPQPTTSVAGVRRYLPAVLTRLNSSPKSASTMSTTIVSPRRRRPSPVKSAKRHGQVFLWLGAHEASSQSCSTKVDRHLALLVDQHRGPPATDDGGQLIERRRLGRCPRRHGSSLSGRRPDQHLGAVIAGDELRIACLGETGGVAGFEHVGAAELG